jgi:hypothetical protein
MVAMLRDSGLGGAPGPGAGGASVVVAYGCGYDNALLLWPPGFARPAVRLRPPSEQRCAAACCGGRSATVLRGFGHQIIGVWGRGRWRGAAVGAWVAPPRPGGQRLV